MPRVHKNISAYADQLSELNQYVSKYSPAPYIARYTLRSSIPKVLHAVARQLTYAAFDCARTTGDPTAQDVSTAIATASESASVALHALRLTVNLANGLLDNFQTYDLSDHLIYDADPIPCCENQMMEHVEDSAEFSAAAAHAILDAEHEVKQLPADAEPTVEQLPATQVDSEIDLNEPVERIEQEAAPGTALTLAAVGVSKSEVTEEAVAQAVKAAELVETQPYEQV